MLLKKEGNHAIDKLRTIVLYEADYNMRNKVAGRQAMTNALHLDAIASEQYSRPQRSAIDHAINRQLVFDHCASRHLPYSLCSCDLQGCYDRIVHSAAILALRRVGVPAARLRTMFGTIQAAIHKVRTVYGDSTSTYSWSHGHFDLPPQGTGQGHGAGPQIWSVLSSVLFDILHEKGFTSSFLNALTNELFCLSGFAYVDDCDMVQLGESIEGVIDQTQRSLSKWESLIHSTGGSLAPIKCWWYLVDHSWIRNKWHVEEPILDYDLTASDKDGNIRPIRRLSISESQEMLGVFMAPDGNTAPQVKALKEKASQWASQITAGFLPASDIWTSMTSGIMKALQYPLPALLLTRDECRTILTPVIDAGLPRCGITRKIPLPIRNGPIALGGLGLPDLFLHMGVARVQKLVEHMWQSTPTTKLLACSVSNLLLEAGVSGNIFAQPFGPISAYLHSRSWLQHTLEFMDTYSITLRGSLPELKPRREHDIAIMTGFLEHIDDKRTLYMLNICRLYLRCSHLSDISTSNGMRIQKHFFGSPQQQPVPTTPSQRRFNWPEQPPPPRSWWNTWRRYIRLCFLQDDDTLLIPLGAWLPTEKDSEWDWFISVDKQTLWSQPTRGTWVSFAREPLRAQRTYRFNPTGTAAATAPPRHDIERTTVTHNRNSIDAQDASESIPAQIPHRAESAREKFIQFLKKEPDSQWIASTITISKSIDNLLADFVTGKTVSVSDGSYFASDDKGAMEWTIEDSTGTEYIRAGGIIPGHPQSAYRSELGGLFGITLGCYALWQIEVPQANILIACDGLGALKKSLASDPKRLTTNCLHFDIISAISKYWDFMDNRHYPVHVHGHMDDVRSSLTRLEKMNVEMDHLAKARVIHHVNSNDPDPVGAFNRGFANVFVKGTQITCNLQKHLLEQCTADDLRTYWIRHNKIETPWDDSIDWNVFSRAFKLVPRHRQHFVIKWISGHGAFGTMMQCRKARYKGNCPLCNCRNETPFHCFTCPDARAASLFSEKLAALDGWLRSKMTKPTIRTGLIQSLKQWRASPHEWASSDTNMYVSTGAFIREQTHIGWFQLCHGFLSTQWVSDQQAYFDAKHSSRSGSLWASQLIRHLWNIVHSMWEQRNKILHKPEVLMPLSGASTLRRRAISELQRGQDQLPPLFAGYFQRSQRSLTKLPMTDLIGWYKTIKLAREGTKSDIADDFSVNGPLRKWIGLPVIPPPSDSDDDSDTNPPPS